MGCNEVGAKDQMGSYLVFPPMDSKKRDSRENLIGETQD